MLLVRDDLERRRRLRLKIGVRPRCERVEVEGRHLSATRDLLKTYHAGFTSQSTTPYGVQKSNASRIRLISVRQELSVCARGPCRNRVPTISARLGTSE